MVNKKYLTIIFSIIGIIGTPFASTSVSAWNWDIYNLHTGAGDNRFDNEHLIFRLNNCLENLDNKFICKYSSTDLMLFTKKEKILSLEIANRFIENIPNNAKNNFYLKYLRRTAVQALAYNGQNNIFLLEIGEHPGMEDAYILASGGDYSLGNIVLNYLQGNSSGLYCRATQYIKPFISQDNENNGVFLNTLISNIDNTNYQIAECAIYSLLQLPISSTEEIQLKLKSLIESNNPTQHRLSVMLEGKFSLTYDTQIRSDIIQKSITTSDINTWYYLNKLLVNLNVMSHFFPLEDTQEGAPNDVVTTMRFKGSSKAESLLVHEYNAVWRTYLEQINFIDAQNFLIEMNKSFLNGIDVLQKISFLKDLPLVNNNRFLKTQLAEAAVATNSPRAPQVLNELYTNANALQKNALIARFPQQFSSKSVIKISETNDWIKLANLTNLLTICNIEVPPIDSELSNPTKLTKYLEKGNKLLEGCSRVAGKH